MREQEPEKSAPARYSKPGRCGTYGRGHDVLYLAAIRTHSSPHVRGKLALVSGNLIIIDLGDGDYRSFYNHHPQRLLSIIKIGGTARIPEGYGSILRGGGGDCFSILPAEEDWVPCDQERPRPSRVRPPAKTPVEEIERRLPDLGPVLDPVYEAIRDWFPRSDDMSRQQLAFAVAHGVLHVVHVEGQLWMASISAEPYGLQVRDATLVGQIYSTVRGNCSAQMTSFRVGW